MQIRTYMLLALVCAWCPLAGAADAVASLRAGATLMRVKVYSLEDDRRCSRASKDCGSPTLRMAWISSGCTTSASGIPRSIRFGRTPALRTASSVSPLPCATCRRQQRRKSGKRRASTSSSKWVGESDMHCSPELFVPLLREGSVVVIEEVLKTDVGSDLAQTSICTEAGTAGLGVIMSTCVAPPTRSSCSSCRCNSSRSAAESGPGWTKWNR